MSAAFRVTAQRYAFPVPMRLPSAAICALGAHALLYGSFRPADGVHGYLGWYEPVLALVAITAVVIVRPERLRTRLPLGDVVRSLSLPALLILLVQESFERTVQIGHPAVVSMTPSGWLVLVVGIVATALVLGLGLRAGQAVFSLLTGDGMRHTRVALQRVASRIALPPARPLAGNVSLRGPPALAR
jgi:hypothetical protein